MNLAFLGKLLEGFQNKQGGDEANQFLNAMGEISKKGGNEEVDPKIKGILDNPFEAIENNEKLRNAVAAQGKQMGWNLFPTTNETSTKSVSLDHEKKDPDTDLGLIKLNEKIRIRPSANATDVANIFMFGKSGCGQTTLLSYLTNNTEFQGTDSMSTQQFHAYTIELPGDTGMTKIRIFESPGMCSGFEIGELEQHWNRLISHVNGEGGVNAFLLLVKSNERIPSQFIDELEEFAELYFEEKEEFWKRTTVVFTTIDELKGCRTFEERVYKLETQIAKPGMEKVKRILDKTGNKCFYVSSIDESDKQRVLAALNGRIHSMAPNTPKFTQSLNDLNPLVIRQPTVSLDAQDERVISKPQHVLSNAQSIEISKVSDRTLESSTIHEPASVYPTENLDFSHSTSVNIGANNAEFLQTLTHEQLLRLLQEMCKDKKFLNQCKKTRNQLFPSDDATPPKVKRGRWGGKWLNFK